MNKVEAELISVLRATPGEYLLGVSGGVDSMALYHAIVRTDKLLGTNWSAVYFYHSGSPIGEGEMDNYQFAKSVVGDKLSLVELPARTKGGKSWEQIGREQRLDFVNSHACDYYVTGHHADDQVETTLIQMFRGMGVGSMGMKQLSGKQLRPFLNLKKETLKEYLQDRGLGWVEDVTNTNTELTRNFWRLEAIPLLQRHYQGIHATVRNMAEYMLFNEQLSHEMAVIDGLDMLVLGDTVVTPPSTHRTVNLVRQALRINGLSMTSELKKALMSRAFGEFRVKDLTLSYGETLVIRKQPHSDGNLYVS